MMSDNDGDNIKIITAAIINIIPVIIVIITIMIK